MQLMATDMWKTQQPGYPDMTILPMTFAHSDHAKQACIDCHHNYSDNTGSGPCLVCHQTEPEIAVNLEQQFHALCMGCHEEKQLAGEKYGPLRRCLDCHQEDVLP